MLSIEKRIDVLSRLGQYILSNDTGWQEAKHRALLANSWFTQGNIDLAIKSIAENFLQKNKLQTWLKNYPLITHPKKLGIVMAGNIPLVGFHDFLCGFVSGHQLFLKLSSKDEVLIRHLIQQMINYEPVIAQQIIIADMLKGCDAYIATGSNNTARYFEQYFGKYPNIIRKNRTSVAILDGTETEEELSLLADDIFSYFGLGCRNVTQVCIPKGYDLTKLITTCDKYGDLILHHKYKHNYDYYLAIYLLNRVPYLTNDTMLLVENEVPFSAVSVLHYKYYDDIDTITKSLTDSDDIQCIIGHNHLPFGSAQCPTLSDYADGIDTMKFLSVL